MHYDMEDLSSETFSDIETDSLDLSDTDTSYSQFPYSNLIHDTPFTPQSYYYQNKNQELKTIFDTDDFPMDLLDIKEEIEEPKEAKLDRISVEDAEDILNNNRTLEAGNMVQTLIVPVINVKTEKYHNYKSDSEESEVSCRSSVSNTDNDEEEEEEEGEEDPKFWSLRRRRRHITSESEDADWEPEMEPEKPVRRGGRGTARPEVTRRERRVQHTPVPQKRKTGTKKITQWIMSLLRDPQYNPSIVTWENEENGTFLITDTAKYAKVWGERKKNPSMNYEKLSRAMRYYYKNGELEAVDRRTTYQFGPMSDFWSSKSSVKE